jgi:chemotaxis protein histidine kinase CheA
MQKMKGSIHIKSAANKGTQITLQLPAHRYIFLNEEETL